MKVITLCPSRGRPKLLEEMVESFIATKVASDLVMSFDEDDPSIDQNKFIADSREIPYLLSFGETVTQHYNMLWNAFGEEYDYIHLTNDDVVYKTKGWDVELAGRLLTYPGVSFGDDLMQGNNLPTMPLISKVVVDAVGWVQLPALTALCGDLVWRDLATAVGRLHYVKHVQIEHRHWINFKRENDKPDYDDVNENDLRVYGLWVATQRDRDILKLKGALNGTRSKSDSIVS